MESFIGLTIVIGIIALLIFYKSTIKENAKYTEQCIQTYYQAKKPELMRKTQETYKAYKALEEEYGGILITNQQLEDLMNGKKVVQKVIKKGE